MQELPHAFPFVQCGPLAAGVGAAAGGGAFDELAGLRSLQLAASADRGAEHSRPVGDLDDSVRVFLRALPPEATR